MNTRDIRRLFVDFFGARGHRHVPSSSLIPPPEERTLLFSNGGMNQMKPYFMGMAEAPARQIGEPATHQTIVQRRNPEQPLPGGYPDVHEHRRARTDQKRAYQKVRCLRHSPTP
jgi:hypothetical protein